MGISASRPEVDDNTEVHVRKTVGRRSSLNLLRRLEVRSASGSQVVQSADATFLDGTLEVTQLATPSTPAENRASITSISSIRSGSATVIHPKVTSQDSSSDQESQTSTPTIQSVDEDALHPGFPSLSNGGFPAQRSSIVLPSLIKLDEESPTNYGLFPASLTRDESKSAWLSEESKRAFVKQLPGPEMLKSRSTASTRSGLRPSSPSSPSSSAPLSSFASAYGSKMSPPITSPIRDYPNPMYTPTDTTITPSELFHLSIRKLHPHEATPTPTDARVKRLLRTTYPECLFRGPPNSIVALSLPLTLAQKDCFSKHQCWQQSGSLGAPVECTVCLCIGNCFGDESDVFWMCRACFVRVCGTCRSVFERDGPQALTERYRDTTTDTSSGTKTLVGGQRRRT